MIKINRHITLDENELHYDFIRASGPGGQHVNKASTAVQLRFDIVNSPSLPSDVQDRLIKLAGNRVTQDGVLIIEAHEYRSQTRNRREALKRLVKLIRRAAKKPKKRRKTKPTRASQARRLQNKRHRSRIKKFRKPPREY